MREFQSCASGVLCTGNYLYHSGSGQESLCMDLAVRIKRLSLGVFGLWYETFIKIIYFGLCPSLEFLLDHHTSENCSVSGFS